MTYPDPAYVGDTGEISVRLRRNGDAADITYPSGTTVDYLATGAATGAKFGVYRWNMSGEPGGAGVHFHRTISESFFVLSGTVRLHNGDEEIDGRPGDYLYVPEGGLHGFRNESGAPRRCSSSSRPVHPERTTSRAC